jgi:hypothetical protein
MCVPFKNYFLILSSCFTGTDRLKTILDNIFEILMKKFSINNVNLKSLGPLIALECSIEANSVVPLFCRNMKNTNIQINFQRAVKTEREPIWRK